MKQLLIDNWRISLSIGGVVPLLVLLSAVQVLQGQPPQKTSPAAEAARARQDRVKTLVVEYKRTEVVPAGAMTTLFPTSEFKPKTTVPAKETTLESVGRLVVDGEKVRVEENHPVFSMPTGEIQQTRLVAAFNGSMMRSFQHVRTADGKSGPLGAIRKNVGHPSYRTVHLMPIWLTFRGQNPVLCVDLVSDMKATGVVLPIDGARCEEYSAARSPVDVTSFWFDPGKDHVIQRVQHRAPPRLIAQTDIKCRRDDRWGWIPAFWKRTDYSKSNQVRATVNIEIINLRINEPQAPEEFDLQFPPGTKVDDERNRKTYVVQEDGSMREQTGDGKLSSFSVPQPGAPWYQRNIWTLASVATAAVLFLVAYSVRWRKAPNSP